MRDFYLVRSNYLQAFVDFPPQHFVFFDAVSFAASVLQQLASTDLQAFFLPNIVYLPYSRFLPCNIILAKNAKIMQKITP